MKRIKQINKEICELKFRMSLGRNSWHDLETCLRRKQELEKQLADIINSPKPMLKNKPAKKKVVAKKKRRMNHRNVFNYLGHHYNTYER